MVPRLLPTASIVVQNTAPSIDGFSITPGSNVEANTTLEMVLSVSDLDNDTLSIQYNWLSGSGQNLGTGSTLTLNNSYAVGSTITAIATLTDAYGASDNQSGVITIDNTDPQVLTPATISASPSPVTGGQLTCSASFTDFNDGSLSTAYTWTNGSTTIGTGSSYTIDASDVSPTDTIYCESSATDNNGSTASSVASIVVSNTNPSVDSVTIAPQQSTSTAPLPVRIPPQISILENPKVLDTIGQEMGHQKVERVLHMVVLSMLVIPLPVP